LPVFVSNSVFYDVEVIALPRWSFVLIIVLPYVVLAGRTCVVTFLWRHLDSLCLHRGYHHSGTLYQVCLFSVCRLQI